MKKFFGIHFFSRSYSKKPFMIEKVEVEEDEVSPDEIFDYVYEGLERNDSNLVVLDENEAKELVKELSKKLKK